MTVERAVRDEYLNAVEAVAGMLSMASNPEVLERCVSDLLTLTANARRLTDWKEHDDPTR